MISATPAPPNCPIKLTQDGLSIRFEPSEDVTSRVEAFMRELDELDESSADQPSTFQAIFIPANASERPRAVEIRSGCHLANIAEAIHPGANPAALLDWGKVTQRSLNVPSM
jgi:hypothetical protein